MCWPEAVGASLRLLMWLNLSGRQELRILSQLEHWIPEALSLCWVDGKRKWSVITSQCSGTQAGQNPYKNCSFPHLGYG